jgi:hypothetical protein
MLTFFEHEEKYSLFGGTTMKLGTVFKSTKLFKNSTRSFYFNELNEIVNFMRNNGLVSPARGLRFKRSSYNNSEYEFYLNGVYFGGMYRTEMIMNEVQLIVCLDRGSELTIADLEQIANFMKRKFTKIEFVISWKKVGF